MWRSRCYQGLNLALLAILAWLPLGTIATVKADHQTGFYLAGMRSPEWRETTCIDTYGTARISHAAARDRIVGTLMFANTGGDWHGFYADHIFFDPIYYSQCSDLNDFTAPRLSDVELRYYVREPQGLYCNPFSCAVKGGDAWSGPLGRVEWTKYNVYLKAEVLASWEGAYRHLINHETGHVFGLDDPPEGCAGSARDSVMHPSYNPYYCPTGDPRWYPTGLDFESVRRIINGAP